jgi:hypothetical protein
MIHGSPAGEPELRAAYIAYVTIHGKTGAVTAMAGDYGCTAKTVYRHLDAAGIRDIRDRAERPSEADLRERYAAIAAEVGTRAVTGKLAAEFDVTYVTIREWLLRYGIRARNQEVTPKRPILRPCPCGGKPIARYRREGPALCNSCYQLKRAADPTAKSRYGREFVINAKIGQPCTDCGGYFPTCCLQWDHVPERGPKLFELGRGDYSLAKIKAEMAKCDLVCANCHVIRTWNRKHPEAPVSLLEPVPGGNRAGDAVAAEGALS